MNAGLKPQFASSVRRPSHDESPADQTPSEPSKRLLLPRKNRVMIRGKTRNTPVMHDVGVNLPHETAVTRKKRSQPRVGCQSLDGNTLSSPVHELDRARNDGLRTVGFVPIGSEENHSGSFRPVVADEVRFFAGATLAFVVGLMIARRW